MTQTIGFCGLVCTDCPAYLATVSNDDELRKSTAKKWSEMYHSNIKPESINCDGCTTPGKKFHHCTECEIRACGIARGVRNCGHCPDYACDKVEAFLKWVPNAKKVLDAERESKSA